MDISTEFTSFFIIAGESLFRVWDINSTIGSAFHGTKNLGASCGACQTNIQTSTEGSGTVIVVFNAENLTIDVSVSFVLSVQVQLFQYPPCQKKTCAIGCGIVGEANLDSILGKLVTVCSSNNSISFKSGIGDLTGDIFVGHTHNHTIFGCIVFVL